MNIQMLKQCRWWQNNSASPRNICLLSLKFYCLFLYLLHINTTPSIFFLLSFIDFVSSRVQDRLFLIWDDAECLMGGVSATRVKVHPIRLRSSCCLSFISHTLQVIHRCQVCENLFCFIFFLCLSCFVLFIRLNGTDRKLKLLFTVLKTVM